MSMRVRINGIDVGTFEIVNGILDLTIAAVGARPASQPRASSSAAGMCFPNYGRSKGAQSIGSANATAKRLGISQGAMSQFLTGKTGASHELLSRIARLAGQTEYQILGRNTK